MEEPMKLLRKLPLAILVSVLLVFTFFTGCETETKIEYVDKPYEVLVPAPVPVPELSFPPVGVQKAAATYVTDQDYELVLLHTNDHHGQVLPSGANGGLAERATYVNEVRAANTNVLLVDAGDINMGTAYSNLFAAEPDFKAYNLMGYDAATFGNHEFDGTYFKLFGQMALAQFPFVSSNIRTANGGFLGGNQYIVENYDGFRVGILGITTTRVPKISSPDKSLIFVDEIAAARNAVTWLKMYENVDIVIALTHLGIVREDLVTPTSEDLAAAVPGIDIIVDGHSHTDMAVPLTVGNTYIVSAGSAGAKVGTGTLTITNGQLSDFSWQSKAITGFAKDADVQDMLQPYIDEAKDYLEEEVGSITASFDWGADFTNSHRTREAAIGNLITDSFMWYAKEVLDRNDVDFALMNGGGIRANLTHTGTGTITREDVFNVLVFDNFIYVVEMKGAKIKEMFDVTVGTLGFPYGGFPQLSHGIEVAVNRDAAAGSRITSLKIGGVNVVDTQTYKFIAPDFLLTGGDSYPTSLTGGDFVLHYEGYPVLQRDVLVDYFIAKSPINPTDYAPEGRITITPVYAP